MDLLSVSSLVMILSGVSAAIALLCFVKGAPYGRYSSGSTARYYTLGLPALSAPTAWFFQEVPSFVCSILTWLVCKKEGLGWSSPNAILLGCFLAHYFNRTFVFPFRIAGGKPTPFGVFLMAFAFCLWNGTMQGLYLAVAPLPPPSPRFWVGLGVWGLGLYINLDSDAILRRLRAPGDTNYYIPKGGVFYFVSGANFLGEIAEWSGFALAAFVPPPEGSSALAYLSALLTSPPVAFAVFTACNIGPRALEHHANYKKRFEDYPKNRKALIPFLL